MYILVALIFVTLLVLAGANLLIEQFNPDDLSNMGIQKR